MLAVMRKNAKNWFIKVLLFMIIAVFVAYFGTTKGTEMAAAIATIDNKPVTQGEYQKEYQDLLEIYRNQLGAKLTDQMQKELNLKQQAFDNLINSAIIQKKAEDLKLTVTDEEVRAVIMSYPAFKVGGVFDERIYQQTLRYKKMTPDEFEAMQKTMLIAIKLQSLIQMGVKVSDREAYDLYLFQNEKINISFVRLAPKDFTKKVSLAQKDLEAYLKDHGDEFRIPEQIQVKYIVFSGEAYADSVKPTEADITDYYDRNKGRFAGNSKDKKTTPPLSEVRDKVISEIKKVTGMYAAYDVAKKAHDKIYQEEKIENYASQNKLAVQTTGFFPAGNPPGELKQIKDFSKAVLTMQKGDISSVLSDEKAYYVLTVTDKKSSYVPALKDIQAEVEKRYSNAEALRLARRDADDMIGRLKKGEKLTTVAQAKGLQIEETGMFVPGATIPKIGASKEINEAVFQLSERKPYPDSSYFVDGSVTVIYFKERGQLDSSDFSSKKKDIKNLLIQMKMKETTQSWLEGTKAAMIKEGRLKIKKEVKEL